MTSFLTDTEKEDIKTEINNVFDKIFVKNLLEKSIKENCSISQYNLAKYYMKENEK